MFGGSSKNCENNCQCSGLITENFRISSGSNATKRKLEDSVTRNYKSKMNPTTLNFSKSPISPVYPGKRRILGEIQLPKSPLERLKSPLVQQNFNKSPLALSQSIKSPLITNIPLKQSPVNSPLTTRKRSRISKVMEERTKFKSSNKENEPLLLSETFVKLDVDEEARDFLFSNKFATREKVTNWSNTKLDFSHSLPKQDYIPDKQSHIPKTSCGIDVVDFSNAISSPKQKSYLQGITQYVPEKKIDREETEEYEFNQTSPEKSYLPDKEISQYVPEEKGTSEEDDFQTLHDLEEEFESNFDECTKYEIISTDSPNIISRGRQTTARKVTSRNFNFGAPLTDNEASTSFNKPNITVTRTLTFEEDEFEFTSPAVKKAAKKSLKFSETPTKLNHEKSDSSIGSMNSLSQNSPKYYTSDSTMESGFVSELSQPFLEIEDSNSPKVENLKELLSGPIKTNIVDSKLSVRRPLNRSISLNPDSRARVSLFSVLENPEERRSNKRVERQEIRVCNKRRKSNFLSPENRNVVQRPVLLRAHSENNASIMSAMERSVLQADLIGDFSLPCALPLTGGDHPDLSSISPHTLARLLRGELADVVGDYQIIDCRYPYEYSGGHISNAVNYHTSQQVLQLIHKPIHKQTDKRSILVFHCEFSIERGPKMCRYLRAADRQHNSARYPSLHYPELYLLHKGYKAFYHHYPNLCQPQGYTSMLDPLHKNSLRHHRTQ